jgi:hypothetical protein
LCVSFALVEFCGVVVLIDDHLSSFHNEWQVDAEYRLIL